MFTPADPPPLPLLIGYLDPGTGFVFSSIGPALLALLGGLIGTGVIFLARFKNKIFRFFRRSDQPSPKRV